MVGQLFDDRHAPLRTGLLALAGLGYLLVRSAPQDRLAPADWAMAVASLVLSVAAARWPTACAAALALVVALSDRLATVTPVVPLVGAGWILLEVAARRPARPHAVLAASALCAAHVVPNLDNWPQAIPSQLFTLATLVGVPFLLGANLRSARLLAEQAGHAVTVERRERSAALAAARSAERTAIARELHDVVAHHVASVVLRVGIARHVLGGRDPRVDEVLDDVHATGTAALGDLRRLVTVLRHPDAVRADPGVVAVEERSLPDALAAAVERARLTGVQVETRIDPEVATIDAVRSLALLRLTQEALTNVATHAGPAARACLTAAVDGAGAVCWEVTDDGGTTAAPQGSPRPAGSGHGLVGMRERVELLGGRLHAGPLGATPGWRLATRLPPAGLGTER
jgi:signal transduction histidine kinase